MANSTARFYAAFYRWSLLTAPHHPAHRYRHVPRRTLSTTLSRRQNDAGFRLRGRDAESRIRRVKHESKPAPKRGRGAGEGGAGAGLRIHKQTLHPGHDGAYWRQRLQHNASRPPPAPPDPPLTQQERYRASPVQTTTARSSSSLRVWEEAVRYRSSSGVMLEIAVPLLQAETLAREWGGERMPKLHESFGARGELGGKSQTSGGERVRSLLVSGGFEDVGRVVEMLGEMRQERNGSEGGKVEEREQVVERQGAGVRMAERPELHVFAPETPTQDTANPAAREQRRQASAASSQPEYSRLHTPSMKPWDSTLHPSSPSHGILQVAIPESQLPKLQTLHKGPDLPNLTKGKYEGLRLQLAPPHTNDAGELLRVVTLDGHPEILDKVRHNLVSLKGEGELERRLQSKENAAAWKVARIEEGQEVGGDGAKGEGEQRRESRVELLSTDAPTAPSRSDGVAQPPSPPSTPEPSPPHPNAGDGARTHFSRYPVRPASVLPSAEIPPWDFAVRKRDDQGLEFETTIPSSRIAGLKQLYGQNLEALTRNQYAGAELSLQELSARGLVAVRARGQAKIMERVRGALVQHRSEANTEVLLAKQSAAEFPFQKWSVRSTESVPSNTLELWSSALRSLAPERAVLELAVPAARLPGLRTVYGAELEELTTGIYAGAAITVSAPRLNIAQGSRRAHDGHVGKVVSLLVAGPQAAVERVRGAIIGCKPAGVFGERVARAERQAVAREAGLAGIPRAWPFLTAAVRSHLALPSARIGAGEFAVRARSEDLRTGTVEIVVPERVWEGFERNRGVERLKESVGSGLKGVEVGQSRVQRGKRVRNVLLEGEMAAVGRARNSIYSWQEKTKTKVVVDGVEKEIDDGAPAELAGAGDDGSMDGKRKSALPVGEEVKTMDDYFAASSADQGEVDSLDVDDNADEHPVAADRQPESAAYPVKPVTETQPSLTEPHQELQDEPSTNTHPAPTEPHQSLEDAIRTWAPYMSVYHLEQYRLHVDFPSALLPSLVGVRGNTRARIMRQSALDFLHYDDGTSSTGSSTAVLRGSSIALAKAVRLIGEALRFGQWQQPQIHAARRFFATGQGEAPRKYYADVRMPGATLARREAFAAWTIGAHGDALVRLATRMRTLSARGPGEEGKGFFRVHGYDPADVERLVEGMRWNANFFDGCTAKEGNATTVVDRWVEVAGAGGYVRVEEGDGDGPVPAELPLVEGSEELTLRTMFGAEGEASLRSLLELASRVLGSSDTTSRICRITGVRSLTVTDNAATGEPVARVVGGRRAVQWAVEIIQNIVANVQDAFRHREAVSAGKEAAVLYCVEVQLPGRTARRRDAFHGYVMGGKGDNAWLMRSEANAFFGRAPGMGSGQFVIRARRQDDVEKMKGLVEAKVAQREDITAEEMRDGVRVLRSWKDEGEVATERSQTESGQGREALPHARDEGAQSEAQPAQRLNLRPAMAIQSEVKSAPFDTDHAGDQTRSSLRRLITVLPSTSEEVRRRMDDLLLENNAQCLRHIQSQTGARIMKQAQCNAGEYLYVGKTSIRIQETLEILIAHVEAKVHVLGVELEADQALLSHRHTEMPDRREAQIARVADDVRAASRLLTHPVVLVTSRTPGSKGSDESSFYHKLVHARGVTVSSFTTVTLHPVPVITFNLKVPSRTWDAISQSRSLCVHILAATPDAATIAAAFTLPHDRPEQPFAVLLKMGYGVIMRESTPPSIRSGYGEVVARLQAVLLADKCVHVGDHVVVLAEVRSVVFPGQAQRDGHEQALQRLKGMEGLAYANRMYRTTGQAIEVPELPEVDMAEFSLAARAQRESRSIETELSEEDDADAFASREMEGGSGTSRFSAIAEEEDEYDLNFPMAYPEAPAVTTGTPSGIPGSNAAVPRSIPSAVRGSMQHTRSYSMTSRRRSTTWNSDRSAADRQSTDSPPLRISVGDFLASPEEFQVDSSVLNETLAEFLGETGEFKARGRMQALLNAKKTAERATREVQVAMADGSLTEERSLQLERTIAVNERRIARKLAFRAADELRRMLDTGKVDVRRSQWLESAVEKGMAICVEDVRKVRALLDNKKIDEAQFAEASGKITQEHGVLNQEAMRLRQMWDDDEDGFVQPPESEPLPATRSGLK